MNQARFHHRVTETQRHKSQVTSHKSQRNYCKACHPERSEGPAFYSAPPQRKALLLFSVSLRLCGEAILLALEGCSSLLEERSCAFFFIFGRAAHPEQRGFQVQPFRQRQIEPVVDGFHRV